MEKVLYLRIDPALHKALAIMAKRDKRSLTNEAEYILDIYAREQLGDYIKLEEGKSPENIMNGQELDEPLAA